MGSTCGESSKCMFDKCLTLDEWINLVNSSNVITKGKARLNRNSMLNGRDRHQQTLTALFFFSRACCLELQAAVLYCSRLRLFPSLYGF